MQTSGPVPGGRISSCPTEAGSPTRPHRRGVISTAGPTYPEAWTHSPVLQRCPVSWRVRPKLRNMVRSRTSGPCGPPLDPSVFARPVRSVGACALCVTPDRAGGNPVQGRASSPGATQSARHRSTADECIMRSARLQPVKVSTRATLCPALRSCTPVTDRVTLLQPFLRYSQPGSRRPSRSRRARASR